MTARPPRGDVVGRAEAGTGVSAQRSSDSGTSLISEHPAGRRQLVKSGTTGLWQIRGRTNPSWKESAGFDRHHLQDWTLALDSQILFKSVRVVVRGEGAYSLSCTPRMRNSELAEHLDATWTVGSCQSPTRVGTAISERKFVQVARTTSNCRIRLSESSVQWLHGAGEGKEDVG